MAWNLLAKTPPSDKLVIRDVNEDVLHRFVEEARIVKNSNAASRIEIASSVREVAEKSVCIIIAT
jgi:hypothetical protein